MKKYLTVSVLISIISILCHFFSFIFYNLKADEFLIPIHWNIQIYILIFISCLMSLLLVFINSKNIVYGIIFLKFGLLVLLGYPLGKYLIIETILFIPIILELIFYVTFPYCSILGLSGGIFIFFNQQEFNVWNNIIEKASVHDLVFFALNSTIILLLASFLKFGSQYIQKKESEIIRLDNALTKITSINLYYQTYAMSVEYDSTENERKRIKPVFKTFKNI